MCERLLLRVGKKKQQFWVLSVGKVWCHQAGSAMRVMGFHALHHQEIHTKKKDFNPDEFHLQLKKKVFILVSACRGKNILLM